MEIENRKGEGNIFYMISNIEGDMGQPTRLRFILQADGDVVISLTDINNGRRLNIEFCSLNGGGRDPEFTKDLRNVVMKLVARNKN